jgi:hypothetical protein
VSSSNVRSRTGTVTQHGLRENLMKCLEEAGVITVVRKAQAPPAPLPVSDAPSVGMHTCGGRLQAVPENPHNNN